MLFSLGPLPFYYWVPEMRWDWYLYAITGKEMICSLITTIPPTPTLSSTMTRYQLTTTHSQPNPHILQYLLSHFSQKSHFSSSSSSHLKVFYPFRKQTRMECLMYVFASPQPTNFWASSKKMGWNDAFVALLAFEINKHDERWYITCFEKRSHPRPFHLLMRGAKWLRKHYLSRGIKWMDGWWEPLLPYNCIRDRCGHWFLIIGSDGRVGQVVSKQTAPLTTD